MTDAPNVPPKIHRDKIALEDTELCRLLGIRGRPVNIDYDRETGWVTILTEDDKPFLNSAELVRGQYLEIRAGRSYGDELRFPDREPATFRTDS